MNNITRSLTKQIEGSLFKGKALVIQGPRQSGKTTLAKELLRKHGDEKNYINCDIVKNAAALAGQSSESLRSFLGEGKLFVIDEAQKVRNIGLSLKILVDTYPDIQIIATGSSSFSLSAQIGEPLVGRMFKYILYPFSLREIRDNLELESHVKLEDMMIYGNYPDVVTGKAERKREYLTALAGNFLYKDIAGFEDIRKPELLRNLLQLVAYQLGNEASYNELADKLQVRRETVMRYLYILEEAFIIFRLYPLSRNLRKEIGRKTKIYFYDLGVRNAIIDRFEPMSDRDDAGALWENFCIVERKKQIQENGWYRHSYFWRTQAKKEIDYVEEYDGAMHAYEFKWGKADRPIPKGFLKGYPGSSGIIVSRSNYLEWLR